MARKEISDIYCWEIDSDDLKVYLASTEKGALRVGLRLKEGPDCVSYFETIYPTGRLVRDEFPNRSLMAAVEAALSDDRVPENLFLDISGTPFQRKTWQAITRIPFGQTRTYGEVAEMVGSHGGARAIGQAMNKNPLPLIHP
jgi:O6-methylguanine-DNA--protein-cysteine methyltransferase